MNGDEREKLNQIHNDVRETQTRTKVIDERTENLSSRMDDMREDIQSNTDDIDVLEDDVARNKTVLGGIGAGATALLLWASEKISRLI